MKKSVILVIFVIILSSISFAKVVDVPKVGEGEDIPLPLVQEEDEIIRYYYSGNSLVYSTNGEEGKYYYQDRLGSNRVSVNLDGEVSNFKSLPYGQVIQEGIQYGFTGKEKDESGLHYFGARYYDSDLGKFTSVDPVASNEPYSYVSNNPMMFVDPDGAVVQSAALGYVPCYDISFGGMSPGGGGGTMNIVGGAGLLYLLSSNMEALRELFAPSSGISNVGGNSLVPETDFSKGLLLEQTFNFEVYTFDPLEVGLSKEGTLDAADLNEELELDYFGGMSEPPEDPHKKYKKRPGKKKDQGEEGRINKWLDRFKIKDKSVRRSIHDELKNIKGSEQFATDDQIFDAISRFVDIGSYVGPF
jgi:RHS repeat-associated protein